MTLCAGHGCVSAACNFCWCILYSYCLICILLQYKSKNLRDVRELQTFTPAGKWRSSIAMPNNSCIASILSCLKVPRCTDENAAHLSRSFPLLEQLSLERPLLTAAGCARLAMLPRLAYVSVHHATDDNMAFLPRLPALRSLAVVNNLMGNHITDSGMQCLSHLTALQGFTFLTSSKSITDESFAAFSGLKQLSDLFVSVVSPSISDDGLQYISHLPLTQLQLNIFESGITPEGSSRFLSSLNQLRDLIVSGTWLTDGSFSGAELPILTTLVLNHCHKLTDAGLEHVWQLPALHSVTLTHLTISDAAFENAACCTSLHTLELDSLRVSCLGLYQITRLPNLNVLKLKNCANVSDAGLACLADARTLQELQLINVHGITDAGFEHLSRLESLRRLDLYCATGFVTGNALLHLARLPQLQHLHLSGVPLSDTDVDYVSSMPALRKMHLHLFGRLSREALQKIAHLLPKRNELIDLKCLWSLNGARGAADVF